MLDDLIISFIYVSQNFAPYLSSLILAAVFLTIGIFLARIIRFVVYQVFHRIFFDEFLEKLNLKQVLDKAEIKRSYSELLGDLFYWLAVLLLIIAVVDFLGMPILPVLNRVLSYIGIIFLAAIILGLGAFFSQFISGIVFVVAANIGLAGAKTIARLIQYATIIFAFLVAIEQLGIDSSLIVPSIGVIIGSVGLALAIAFGLGCKDIMADFISNLIREK